MKKIIIVNNNLEIGGVQKSLYNLLWAIHDRYEVTVCLFSASGVYWEQLPPDVRIVEPRGSFRYLGRSQSGWRGLHALLRGGFAAVTKGFGRKAALRLMSLFEPALDREYDVAISFLQNGRDSNFYGGTQEYVLEKVRARKKVALLHCDFAQCGSNTPANRALLARFDQIALCSDGCRRVFEQTVPELAHKTVTLRNFHRLDEIHALAGEDTVEYDGAYRNVVMVSRLAHEKGIDRAITAAAKCVGQGIPVRLHIVGGGPELEKLRTLAQQQGMEERIFFYGEQANSYRYMKNADLFLMTSYHEAAPMVIDEAVCLGVPVLSTRTTSSDDMITGRGCGWVCENTQEALNGALLPLLRDAASLADAKARLAECPMDNRVAAMQLETLLEE